MCLAVPGKIIEISGEKAVVDFGGIQREAVISLLKDPAVGEWVIVHAGFAIQKWSEEDVAEYQAIVKEMDDGEKGRKP